MRNIVLDSQVLNGIQDCMYKYNLSYVRNLTSAEKSVPLESGDLLHTIFKVYYLLKIKRPDLHHNETTKVSLDFGRSYSGTLTQATDSSDEVLHHASEYFNFYEDDSLIPKHVEQSFSIVLHEDKDEDFRVVYQGVVDLVAEYIQNGVSYEVGIDHKSTRRNSDPSYLALSNQFRGYFKSLNLDEFLVNKVGFQKTLKPKDRFLRHWLSFDAGVLDEWVKNTVWWAQHLSFCSDNDTYPQNFTSCDKFFGCKFREVCSTRPGEEREFILKRDFITKEEWNPHKKDEGIDEHIEKVIKEA